MYQTHWKKLQNPDYLGAYSLEPGKDLILTIASVKQEKVTGADGKKEECMVCRFAEPGVKPMILNVTNCKTIEKIYKTPYIEEWAGRKIQLFVEKVKAFGDVVDALRIRALVPRVKATTTKCTDCNKDIEGMSGKSAEWVAQYTQEKYGKPLCSECATKAAEDKTKKVVENPLAETETKIEAENEQEVQDDA